MTQGAVEIALFSRKQAPGVKIRPANSSDDLIALWRDVYQADYVGLLPEGVDLPFEPRGQAYVAEIGGRAAAFSYVDGEWLDELWVSKPFQGRGIGAALVRHAEAIMRDAGVGCARLSVLQVNARAMALYRRLGWTQDHAFQDRRSGVWNIEFTKELSSSI
jgi:ribosomal protein S18 acetylase RimI-like enzyme